MHWHAGGLLGVELIFHVGQQVVELAELKGVGVALQFQDRRVFELVEQLLLALLEPLTAVEESYLHVDRLLGDEDVSALPEVLPAVVGDPALVVRNALLDLIRV